MAITDQTSRLKWTLPQEGADPWYQKFLALISEIDAAAYSYREDRNMLLAEGGTISWSASTGILSWTNEFVLNAPVTGFKWEITAGSASLNDGDILYATVVRSPTENKTLVANTAQRAPTEPSGNDQILIAIRIGTSIIFRNGYVLVTGASTTNFEPASGGGVTSTFVYQPGGTPSGNVYDDWATLYAAVSSTDGPVWIEFDATYDPISLPSGTYDFKGNAFFGSRTDGARVSVALASGCVIKDVSSFNHLTIYAPSASTGRMEFLNSGVVTVTDCQIYTSSSANAILLFYPDNTLYLRNSSLDSIGASYPVYTSSGGEGAYYIYEEGYSSIDTDVFSGAKDIDVWLESGWCTCSETHTALTGTLTVHELAAGGVTSTFVYQPGGTPSGNVYDDWATLYAAASAVSGPIWVEFDASFGAVSIPSGTYDFKGNASFLSSLDSAKVSVSLASGCVIQDVSSFTHLTVYAPAASTGRLEFSSSGSVRMIDCTVYTSSSANAIMLFYPDNTLYLLDSTLDSIGASYPVYASSGGEGAYYIYEEGYSSIDTDVFSGTKDIDVWLENTWCTCSETHTALTGTLTVHAPAVGGDGITFVFQPGGTPAGNVYDTWSTLYSDFSSVTGPRFIVFDSSQDVNSRCDIPSGTYSLSEDTVLRGDRATVLMADGAVFQDALVLDGVLDLYSASTSNIFTWSSTPRELVLKDSVSIFGSQLGANPAPTSPLIGSTATLEVRDNSALKASSGDQPVLQDTAGASVVKLYDSASVIAADGGIGDSYALNCSGAGTVSVRLYDQGVYYQHVSVTGLTWYPYCVRSLAIPLSKGVVTNSLDTPASCGTAYVSFKNIPKHANALCKYRVIIETSSGNPGYEAYIDLYDAHGQLNAGVPAVVTSSQIDTGSGSPPTGAPTPNSLVPSLYEVDLTSAIIGGTWVSDIAILESRVWIGTAGGGNAASCKSAELVFEWTEN